MKSELRHYAAGEILFREGEDSDAAFVVETGRIALLKATSAGDVRIEDLGKGDLFGETGVLDKGPRSGTARAETEVTVRVIPRDEFLRAIETDPHTALKIMTRLAKRQRAIDERLARSGLAVAPAGLTSTGTALVPVGDYLVPTPASPTLSPLGGGIPPSSLVGRVLTALGLLKRHSETQPPKLVVVAPLSLEAEYDQRPYLIEAIQSLEGIVIRPSRADLSQKDAMGQPVSPTTDPAKARVAARQMLADEKADLLIWGGEDEGGRTITLWFATASTLPADHLGNFPLDQGLCLPADFDENWTPLIGACILSALGGTSPHLASLVEKCRDLGMSPPAPLDIGEQSRVMAAFGYCAAIAGVRSARPALMETAAAAWRSAISLTPRHEDAEWARLHASLGVALQTRGEKARDEASLRDAAGAFQTALEAVRREDAPQDWGRLQARLGSALFQIDMLSGDEQALRNSLSAYKAALSTTSRAEDPWRWADLMHGIAQALQVWGDHTKNAEALRKAADLCRAALEVRTPDTAPALFAATRNNMGSALFLLAKQSGEVEYMRLAATAFREALAVHRASGAGGPLYKTIEKNLRRAEDLLKRHERRPVASVRWADEIAAETVSLSPEPDTDISPL